MSEKTATAMVCNEALNTRDEKWMSHNIKTRAGLYIKNGLVLQNDFFELYRVAPDPRKIRRSKLKRKWDDRHKKQKKVELAATDMRSPHALPSIEVLENPSSFAVYSQVRTVVLENIIRMGQQIYLNTTQTHSRDSDSDEDMECNRDNVNEIPKIVGLGLVSVYELIRGSVSAYPALCIRALEALLDILQGQQPEALSKESPEVIDTLFDLLLRLATASNGDVLTCPSSPLVGVACACLLSLVVARGETRKFLRATADILMTSRQLASQNIQVPIILTLLQRSVHAVLLGKTQRLDWLQSGISASACIEKFPVNLISGVDDKCAMACDGHYLYFHSKSGLYKVGSGFGGTTKGHVYLHRPDFYPYQTGWLGFAHSDLLFRPNGGCPELMVVDREVLKVTEVSQCTERGWDRGLAFSDGSCIGTIVPDREDGFVIRTYNPQVKPMPLVSEVSISLAEHCIQIYGGSDDQSTLSPGLEEDLVSIVAGKDFVLGRTASGRVYYSGKGSSLGMKQSNTNAASAAASNSQSDRTANRVSPLKRSMNSINTSSWSRWTELSITKSPRIIQIAVGHEGQHAILVSDEGSAFFVGTSRRGEDGDSNKVRRQPKPVKPKKMIKMEGNFVTTASCNNGTSALVTRDGELYMFGKDTFSCDPSCGLVTDLKDVHITSVALGKAHLVALTNKGQIYSLGINNKGQCGRDFALPTKDSASAGTPVPMGIVGEEEGEEEEGNESGEEGAEWVMCPTGHHRWVREYCMVCTVCHECSGYGVSCVSSGRPNRSPGQPCGCGSGDSGCAECGCCRACADELEVDGEQMPMMQPLGLLPDIANLGGNLFGHAVGRLPDHLPPRAGQRKNHVREDPNHHPEAAEAKKGLDEAISSDHERESSKAVAIAPGRVHLPTTSPVVQIACGLHHTIVLCSNGEVYTWGSNTYGQLGTGDVVSHGSPTLLRLPPILRVTSIAAGSNHSVILTSNGQIHTFGAYQKGQLGRRAPQYDAGEGSSRGRAPWYSVASIIPGIGPRTGKRASWIGASADTTFIKLDQSLINAHNLQSSDVVANSSCILLLPTSTKTKKEEKTWKSLAISRSDGSCRSFTSEEHADFRGQSVCLDPVYNVIWSYDIAAQEVKCYNIIAAKAARLPTSSVHEGLRDVLSPALSLPVMPDSQVSRAQVALHLLSCMDTITWAQENGLTVSENESLNVSVSRVYTKEDFVAVNRFESHGGGWGYSGHSVEAIRFMCDTDVLIGGFGLFGGRGEYLGKIKIFELGPEGADQETEGELVAETDEIAYECGARQKYAMLFDEPVPVQANKWFVAWARVSGPSSDCGSSGQSMITTEDQVIFYFKSSKKSNNGTDVNAGQIPQLLYRVISPESKMQSKSSHFEEHVPILSRAFSMNVTNDVFHSLLELLNWSWTTLCSCISEHVGQSSGGGAGHIIAKLDLQRLVYICCSCLRLLRIYINEIYPNSAKSSKCLNEKSDLAESVAEVRALLRQMLSSSVLPTNLATPLVSNRKGKQKTQKVSDSATLPSCMIVTVLEECHSTFVSCFHAFYPTGQLKWTCLCDLLLSRDEGCEQSHGSDRLLSAVLASLCSPTIRLRATCPILTDNEVEVTQKPSPADNAALSTLQPGDLCQYPVLVDHMTKIQSSNGVGMLWTFREVLDRLLGVISGGVRQALRGERVIPLPSLVHNTCLFLAAAVAELSAETTTSEREIPAGGRALHVTPCRFTRMSQSRTWSTGNGSPDAICFSVDRPGILIAGVCVYGGVGSYDYELELMDEGGPNSQTVSHTLERWNTVEATRGSFGPDDTIADIAELKYDKPFPVKDGVKYAIRLTNRGGRTSNGDGGLASVKGGDGTTFSFSACSLSVNGTNQIRGQIPQILYYSTPQDPENQHNTKEIAEHQARKSALTIMGSILRTATELMIMGLGVGDDGAVEVLGLTPLFSTLLPLLLANIKPVAVSDPRSAVAVIGLVQEILPHVSALNNLSLATQKSALSETIEDCHTTTSNHYSWVESDHPYRPATVAHFKITFTAAVQWMALEFDLLCGTAQPEDSLQIYIPCEANAKETMTPDVTIEKGAAREVSPHWIVMNKFSGTKTWPKKTIVFPGNQLVFSLETASDYVKDEKANTYGFRVLVIGYEWPPNPPDSIRHLEKELAYLGGFCAASLMKKSLVLPPIPGEESEEDMDVVEEISMQVYFTHPTLLSKGFALSHPPTIHQTLDGIIPFSCHSNERLFLRDFVSCTSGTSGGRLARWLQPDSYVDIRACEVLYSKDDMRAGWPAIITVITRDQYNEVVYAPGMKVEVTAVPVSTGEDKPRRFSQVMPDNLAFGGHPQPNLEIPYQVSIKDKMCYCSISMMKGYDNYSFEELRYVSPAIRRPSENMLVRSNNDGSYSCNWTPGSIGWYSLSVKIDGYQLDKICKLEVKDPPQGMVPPLQNAVKKPSHQPSRLRKFNVKNSAGLRIRTHPSLQSEQLGIIPVNGTIAFVDEVHNNDGVWLRLSLESIRQYCRGIHSEAWCLQYNQHLGKTMLVPLDQPKSILDQVITDTITRRGGHSTPGGSVTVSRSDSGRRSSVYTVIKCGASGHNIRSKPSLKAPPVGMLVLGNAFTVDTEIKNSEGSWVRLDCESTRKYCFTDGEAWSLSVSKGQILYLQCSQPSRESLHGEKMSGFEGQQSGFDFTNSQSNPVFKSFQPSASEKSPFVFGSPVATSEEAAEMRRSSASGNDLRRSLSEDQKSLCSLEGSDRESPSGGRPSAVGRWMKEEASKKSPPGYKKSLPIAIVGSSKDIPPELQGVSVKELVKAIGESRANGNGATPPRTPPATPKKTALSSSPRASFGTSPKGSTRSSSPISVPGKRDSASNSPFHVSPSGVTSCGSIAEEGAQKDVSPMTEEGIGGSLPCESREERVGGSLPCESRSQLESNFLSCSSSPPIPKSYKGRRIRTFTPQDSPPSGFKTVTQSATQTSPPDTIKFNIGSSKEESPRLSPKGSRKERSMKHMRVKKERPVSPGVLQRERLLGQDKVKEAMSPSVAECLRAVFAAFLWHEGIVHDAMACASYLKFHPELIKQSTFMWKLCQTSPGGGKSETKMTKEQKARQRHSVEVSAYSYLNVTIQNTDDLHKLGTNANIAEDGKSEELVSAEPSSSFQGAVPAYKLAPVLEGGASYSQQASELPLVLRYAVILWEELNSSCLKAITQQVIIASPTVPLRIKKSEKVKEKPDKEKKKNKKKPVVSKFSSAEDDPEDFGGQCELCTDSFSPHTAEQHFLSVHPGCGGASHGCGYVGTKWKFFPSRDRLPLPCGEVCRGCYHMCWSCRNKYKEQSNRLTYTKDISERRSKRKSLPKVSAMPNVDTHVIMRNNAMFLLDLASAASTNIFSRCNAARRSPCTMPCVSELSPDSCPFPKITFQCLHTLNCQQQHLNQLREDLLLQQHALQSSDATTANGYHTSSGESKDTHRDSIAYSPGMPHQESPASDPEVSWGRPFHRSISVTMGPTAQDWSSAAALSATAQNENNPSFGVILRKRNNSSSENSGTGVSSLVAHPSASLEKLVSHMSQPPRTKDPGARSRQVISRPVMSFIFQKHDLETLAFAMRHATRRTSARVYAMQALNWLLRSVTQPTCLHDLLWAFVLALTPDSPVQVVSPWSQEEQQNADGSQLKEDHHDLEGEMTVLEHPLSDVTLSGDAVHPLRATFHQLLQTIADLMMLLPPGSPLQMMAVRCWGLRFTPNDHDFLHQSHVFSNISKILSRSEEVLGAMEEGSNSLYESHGPASSEVETLTDLTSECEVKVSSRQAMVSSLTDSSTETFWESGDEDRNKTKAVTVYCPPSLHAKAIYVHIDNCRDLGNKVSAIIFKCGATADDVFMIHQMDIESRFSGWVHAYLPNDSLTCSCIITDLRGPDQSVRVRQIRILGLDPSCENSATPRPASKILSPLAIQHRACEQETLKVFRLITSQVFGRLLNDKLRSERDGGEEENARSSVDLSEDADHNNDLREHMVGILFSRSKLNHLQKQVCSHIVQAIKKESKRARDEWELSLANETPQRVPPSSPDEGQLTSSDTYCFEMLSMVLALSGSAVGRAHLAHQENLLKHLLSLLHTGSARVQRQVVALFRRMLVDITPATLAQVLGIVDLPVLDLTVLQVPSQDNEEPFDMHKHGILDVFLAIIAKALVVQIKTKGNEMLKSASPENSSKAGITSVTLSSLTLQPHRDSPRWYLQGVANRKLADLIISLIRDMTFGKLSDPWSQVSKGAVAENIINLTRLHEKDRSSVVNCLSTPALWLALASLCVLHPDHIDALSSQQWRATVNSDNKQAQLKPMCDNHDDGGTAAMILCDVCGNLCGECDRILHLHSRTRSHHRTVFREEQQAIKVDLHEGCGRTKLFWLLALADSTTLKAMIELRGENSRTRGPGTATSACRFCGSPAQASLLSPIPVCQDTECQEYSKDACTRVLNCSHLCGGIKGETDCLPCLVGCSADASLKQDADDMCMICFSEALSAAPAIQLECGHVFHYHCTKSVLAKRWPGPRITFTFSLCPICKVSIKHWSIAELLHPITALYEDVRRKALMRLEYEGILKSEAVSSPGTRYCNDPASYAMERYAYYVCFKCSKAYYGGEARCENEAAASDDYDPKELVCGACSDVSRAQMCPKHGTDFLEYKCRYCCSVAVFFCFGTTHFCNACHEDFQRVTNIAKTELPHCPAGPRAQQLPGDECPLHVKHPATGEEFALGCGVCRNAHTF